MACHAWDERRNPLSIQVCFNPAAVKYLLNEGEGRNPLSIQVCFNKKSELKKLTWAEVVIPYQFRSVSISVGLGLGLLLVGRNPLSIQVCFNPEIMRSGWML